MRVSCLCLFGLICRLVKASQDAKHRVQVCFLTRNNNAPTRAYSQQLYQLQKHSHPGIEFAPKLLYNDQDTDTRAMLRTIVANGTDCHVFLGPFSSSLALGTGPLISAPQVDSASGSQELSDSTRFPFYNRVNAVQAPVKVTAKVIHYFGWKLVNVLCTDESLGRGKAQVLAEVFAAENETSSSDMKTRIGTQHCVSSNPTHEEVNVALQQVSRGSRILVLAVNHLAEAWDMILAQIKRLGMDKTHVIFLPSGQLCAEISGMQYALCVDGMLDIDAFAPVLDDYTENANLTQHRKLFVQAGVDPEKTEIEPWDHLITHLAHDAVTFLMRAYEAEHDRDPTSFNPSNFTAMTKALRSFSLEGITGLVELDEIGDRRSENLYNVYSMGNASGEQTAILDNRHNLINSISSEPVVWFDGSTEIPQAEILEDLYPEETEDSVLRIFAGVVGATFALMVVLVFWWSVSRVRNVHFAPTSTPVTLAFTDIESSTKLWRKDPVSMSQSLEIHNKIIRRNIAKHRGYEVKTVGDAFMISTKTVDQMVRIAVDTQRELRSYPSWPSKKIVIKIRFGIHQGSPEIVFDKVAKGYDYFGDDVNKAARIEGLCNGRQILISDSSLGDTEVLVGLEKELNIRLGSSSPHILKGIDVPVELREIFFDSELNSSSGFFGQDSRSLDCELPRPTFLRVASDQCTATGEEENPMQRLYMTIMDGFFTTAVSHNETDNRFNWMARLLTTKLDANNDEEKLRLLTHRLGCLADQEAVKRACRQVVESDRAAALSAEEDDGDFTGSSAWDDKDFTQEASRT